MLHAEDVAHRSKLLSQEDRFRAPPERDLKYLCRGDVKVELGQIWGRVSDPEALEAVLNSAWMSFSQEWLEWLIRSMPTQLQAVMHADGYPNEY